MNDRTWYRLGDALDAIAQIGELLNGKVFSDVQSDRPLKAAMVLLDKLSVRLGYAQKAAD